MKITLKAKTSFKRRPIERRVKDSSTAALYKAAGYLRTTARRSIKKRKHGSQPGEPPHTRLGQLRNAILFAVDEGRQIAWVGPSAALISDIARYHEFGGVQFIKSERRKYRIGSAGPIDTRAGYTNPYHWKDPRTGATHKGHHSKEDNLSTRHLARGVAFATLKTQLQVDRARFLDRVIWPDSDLLKRRKYPPRPFMGPAMEESLGRLGRIFNVSLAPANSL